MAEYAEISLFSRAYMTQKTILSTFYFMHFCPPGTLFGILLHFLAQSAEKVIENEILLCKWHILSNVYFMKKNDLLYKIPSLFSGCSQKMPKSAKRSARIAKVPFIKSA